MQLNVSPEGLEAASAQVAALTARVATHNAIHAATGSAVLPPGSDPVSIKVSTALLVGNVEHQAAAAMGNTQLAMSSIGVGESGSSYAIGDSMGAAAFAAAAV